MKAVFFHPTGSPDELRQAMQAFPQVSLAFARDAAELQSALPDAEILITGNRSYTPDHAKIIREQGTSLKWIQFSTSGMDKALASGLPSGVVVTNVAGLRAFAVAEHAFSLMLALVRRTRRTEDARREKIWARDEISPSTDNLAGKHLVIIGLGAIGQEIARKAKAFDMQVTGISRSVEKIPHVDRVRPRTELVAACAEADIVSVAAGLDESTKQILSGEAIAAMRPTALVVNIARGQLIDETALIEALQAGKLAGAGLDVTVEEPLPGDHPLWALDNVVLTPHIGGAGSQGIGGGLGQIFAENLRRWLAGSALNQVVIARTP